MRPISLACTLTLLLGLLAGCASTAENLETQTGATGSLIAQVEPVSPLVQAPAVTPSPPLGPEASMLSTLERWAQVTSTPYRNAHVTTLANLGYFATVEVVAWLRPLGSAAWEVQTTESECWLFEGSWQCNGDLAFRPADAETKRQAALSATATAVVAAAEPVAEVDSTPIAAIDFQKRVRYEKYAMEKRLVRLRVLEQQFGRQDDVAMQISQLLSTLDNMFALGSHTLESMIEEAVIAKEAAARGISVSDEEVDQALHEEIANARGLVTEPQAMATAAAAITATATAAQWTPIPTATREPNGAPIPIVATLDEPPPAGVMPEAERAQGIADFNKELARVSGLAPDEYREIVRGRLLRQKLSAVIGGEKVFSTEEQAHAFQAWLEVQVSGDMVKRPADLAKFLPPDLTDPARVTRGTADGTGVSKVASPQPDVPADWIEGATLGDPSAPLEVQIWVDYLCPSCQSFADIVEPQLVEKYVEPGKIRLTLHFFPLQQFEPEATLAALAAACAGEQNRFWPYHSYLMAMTRQDGKAAVTFQALTNYASEVGLDADAFAICLAEQKAAGVVAASAAEAQALSLQFVPSVIVGDTLLQDTTFEGVQAEINRQLQ